MANFLRLPLFFRQPSWHELKTNCLDSLSYSYLHLSENFILHLEVTLEHVKDEKGVDHLSIKDFKYTYEFGDNVSFDIKHLIKDNEKLSEELVKNMNENWKTFADILIVPILKYAVKKGMEVAGTLMSVIPSNEILLP